MDIDANQVNVTAEIDQFFDDSSISTTQPPRAVIFAGGVGAGKTRMRRAKYSVGFVVLDAGEIFLRLCEGRYLDFPGPLEEPMDLIGYGVARRIFKERRHFVTEIIGAELPLATRLIEAIKGSGYLVDFIGLTCDVNVAWERNVNRGENNISAFYMEPFHQRWILANAQPSKL
jgi:hypothetical protein